MNRKTIDETIKIVKKLIEGVDEKYKVEAFGVILSKLLNSEIPTDENTASGNQLNSSNSSLNDSVNSVGKKELARQCKISIKEIDDVVSIKKDHVQIISPLEGNEPQKQILAAQCVLLTYEVVLKKEWVDAETLARCIDKSGISITNLGRTLKQNPSLIRGKGIRKYKEYKLFGPGRISAFKLFQKLAKG